MHILSSVLTIPGLGGSGEKHWQTVWENRHNGCTRVRQDNWNIPDFDAWMVSLHAAIKACKKPPLLVAHSLGCALVVHWASKHAYTPIQGALLVAPADVDSEEHTPPEAHVFAPLPLEPLPFPSTVVCSSNDTYVSPHRAHVFATAWGADYINIGPHGHINADSHLGFWDEGWNLLQNVTARPHMSSHA